MIKPINSDNSDYYSNNLSNSESVQSRPASTEDLTIPSTKAIEAIKPPDQQPQNYELLIKFKPETSAFQQQAITGEMAMKNLQKFSNIPNLVTVTVRSSQPIDSVLAQLKKNANIEFIELNREFKLPDLQPPVSYTADQIRAARAKFPGADFSVPNDTNFAQQWDKQSQGDGPASSGSINAQSAWRVTTGSQDVVVAVLDTGIDYNHPDLANNIWTGPDGSHGYNAVDNNNDPLDDNSHGTQVAGIIGAVGNNRQGVAGVNWNVKLMPIKIANARGSNETYDVLEAIDYVLTQKKNGVNIRVLNNSWGGDPESPALREAIKELDKVGILFVAAAGNSSVNNDDQPSYPASYDLPNVITVAATDRNGDLADFSNYGSHTVHIAAPGMDVLTTAPGGDYSQFGGTSSATPYVSGAAALLLSLDPTLTPEQLKTRLMESVTKETELSGKIASGGLLNIGEAVRRTPMKPVALGEQGNRVAQLQELLNKFGYNLVVDGDFGPATETALRDYQKKHSLPVSGAADLATLTSLRSQEIVPMQLGENGNRVRQLQELLNKFGYDLAMDGDFGNVTETAVRDFQREHGLLDDGVVGPLTFAALNENN